MNYARTLWLFLLVRSDVFTYGLPARYYVRAVCWSVSASVTGHCQICSLYVLLKRLLHIKIKCAPGNKRKNCQRIKMICKHVKVKFYTSFRLKCCYQSITVVKPIHRVSVCQVLRSVDSPGTVITAVVLSHGGRMLFVGTSSGAVRSLRFPLATPGEWSEFRGHGSAISKVTHTSSSYK